MLRISYPNNTVVRSTHNISLEFKKRLKAANQGSVSAQFAVALSYEKGEGVTQNVQLAFKWCKKAATQDWRAAIYHLAYMYREGIGTTQDQEKSFQCYEKAALLNFSPAICELAWMDTHSGFHRKAMIRYKMAAVQNSALALYNLAWMHEQYDFFGLPIEKSDKNTIIHYYTQAHHYEPRKQAGMLACFALILFTIKDQDDFLKSLWVDPLKKHPCYNQLPHYYQEWIDTIALVSTPLKIKASLYCRLGIAHLIGAGLPQQDLQEAQNFFQKAHNLGHAQAMTFLDIADAIPMLAETKAAPLATPPIQWNTVQTLFFSQASEGSPLVSRNASLQNAHSQKRPHRLCCKFPCTIL